MLLQCPVLKHVLSSIHTADTDCGNCTEFKAFPLLYLAQVHGTGWPGSPETSAVFCFMQVAKSLNSH